MSVFSKKNMKVFSINAIWIIPLIYSLIAILSYFTRVNRELFPFFYWGLYSHVPQYFSVYKLEVELKNDKIVDMYTLVSAELNKVEYRVMLESFVSNINSPDREKYLNRIKKYIPNNLVVKLLSVQGESREIIGVFKDGSFISIN